MRKSMAQVLAGTALLMVGLAKAEMDVDCFIVGRLRGDQSRENRLTSDLPKLLQGYKQTLMPYSLAVYSTDRGVDNKGAYIDRLDALELTLEDQYNENKYPMNIIGNKGPNSTVENFTLDAPLDRIDILYNDDHICNVKFMDVDDEEIEYQYDHMGDDLGGKNDLWDDEYWIEGDDLADEFSPYAVKNDYCIVGSPNIEIMSVYMEDIRPIAGMHGRANNDGPGLESLNFIWFDEETDKCIDQA
jgi:hypothetical protein